MSTSSLQDQPTPSKRGYFQRGQKWIRKRLDGFRNGSAPPPSARPSDPQVTGVSSSGTITSTRDAVRRLDVHVPLNEHLIPEREIPFSRTSQLSDRSFSVSIERSIRDDHAPPLPELHPDRAQAVCAENRPLDALPQGHNDQDSPQTSSHGPDNTIQTVIGNVVTGGVNHGTINMNMDNNDFTATYRDWLKVSAKADHMYYANSDENALQRRDCTPGTRVEILEGAMSWATNTSAGSEIVYWLSGQAGAGKTTIAYTFALQLGALAREGDRKVILGGSFFCSRQFLETRSASSIVRTIVYQLALRSKSFREALRARGRLETVDHGPKSQIQGLLVEPWKLSASKRLAEKEPCYVIPLDALDELEGKGGTEFLGSLFDVANQQDLLGLKFFVTSRSEPALVKQIESFTNKQIFRLEEVPLEQSNADIKLYLNENLAQCATPEQIQQLVSDAAGLFIYVATLVEYVKGRGVEEQRNLLREFLSKTPSSQRRPRNATATLDNLYLQILKTCLVDPRDRGDLDVFQDCLSILHTFLCTIERTSVSVAVAILQEGSKQSEIDNASAEGVLLRLHAVLYIQNGQVMSFHKSFSDFLFDQHRSKGFYCNQEQLHCRLVVGCFRIMARQLQFNIADIPTYYQMDNDNPALLASIGTNISYALRYAYRNWRGHLVLAPLGARDRFAELLHLFCNERDSLGTQTL
ncbi:hypothetical protein BKA70DRAFT_1162165 [Coprinopsis sp. MPI-PUGE-AT-0042]|nr:hypothetical protein BKA70DRAFT_1162165 [Coprinopsis sp. MPI-PUGE-AT-0042]